MLLTIKRNEYSWPFLEAVEEVNTPDFFEVIKVKIIFIAIQYYGIGDKYIIYLQHKFISIL